MNAHTRIPDDIVNRAREADCLDVAKRFGAQLKAIGSQEHVGPCPACGGRDRFSVNTARNVFHCRQSGAGGDAIALWRYLAGCNFAEAVSALTGYAIEGVAPAPATPPKRHETERSAEETNAFRLRAMREAYEIWRRADPAGRLVRAYLERRAIPFPDWHLRAIREIGDLPFWHTAKGDATRILHRGPAMVAAITGPDGRFLGLHRTWIDPSRENGKPLIVCPVSGEVLNPKKVLGSMRRGKIELRGLDAATAIASNEPYGEALKGDCHALVAGEGIETVFAWNALHGEDAAGMALWSAISLGNLAGKAEKQIAHPSITYVTKNRQVRKRKVPGPDPDWSDDRCMVIPGHFHRVILLGDGDSDPFTTRVAMRRARARHEIVPDAGAEAVNADALPVGGRREVQVDFAAPGKDWDDVLREARR